MVSGLVGKIYQPVINWTCRTCVSSWGCRDGAMVRALNPHHCGPEHDVTYGLIFAVGSCPWFSPGSPVFFPSQKPTLQTPIQSAHLLLLSSRHVKMGDGQNTDPQSMDYPYGLPKWTTLNYGLPLTILLQYYSML